MRFFFDGNWQIKSEQKSAHGWDGLWDFIFFQIFAISLSIRHEKIC